MHQILIIYRERGVLVGQTRNLLKTPTLMFLLLRAMTLLVWFLLLIITALSTQLMVLLNGERQAETILIHFVFNLQQERMSH